MPRSIKPRAAAPQPPRAAFWDRVFAQTTAPGAAQPRVLSLGRRLPAGARVLDVGAGNGAHAIPLAALGHTVDALDCSSEGLRRCGDFARERGLADRVRLIQADLLTYAYPRARYDFVIAVASLQNVADASGERPIESVIARLKAATRRGGWNYLLLTTDVRTLALPPGADASAMSAGELLTAWKNGEKNAVRIGSLDRAGAAGAVMRQYGDPAWKVESLVVPSEGRLHLFAMGPAVLRCAYWVRLTARRAG